MSRGKKLTDEQRQAVLGVYRVTGTVYHTARQLKMPLSTVHRILRQAGVSASGAAQKPPAAALAPVSVREAPAQAPKPPEVVEADIRTRAWPRLVAPAADELDAIYAQLRAERTRDGGPDTKVTGSLMTELYRGSLSFGILVDKAKQLSSRDISIETQARELNESFAAAGWTLEQRIEALRARIQLDVEIRAGLQPAELGPKVEDGA